MNARMEVLRRHHREEKAYLGDEPKVVFFYRVDEIGAGGSGFVTFDEDVDALVEAMGLEEERAALLAAADEPWDGRLELSREVAGQALAVLTDAGCSVTVYRPHIEEETT